MIDKFPTRRNSAEERMEKLEGGVGRILGRTGGFRCGGRSAESVENVDTCIS